ncbi:MAG: Na+:solute symporter [Candidatus Eremiobacteraeota bacterium]|nr:Na+:solute symporter [Candidatus Eremiobacteraeota bacterium]
MTLSTADYVVIFAFFAINLGIGLYFARRGGTSVSEFFLSGRSVPWWLAGVSMVATTFAVDTPLAVTGFVTQHGIAGNWVWWSSVMSGILTVFFFAKLWRRSGVLTDVEFIELRYSGAPAAALRLVRALFQGVFVNTVIMGWVNLAMAKVLELTLHVQKLEALAVCLIFTAVYVTIGGLWGVLVTDLLQFVVKMSMAIVLAVASVAAVGGIPNLIARLHDRSQTLGHVALQSAGAARGDVLAFFPTSNEAWLPLLTFFTYIGVQWWASSYPGAEPGGGGYIAQRIFSAKSENDSLLATLFFNVAHYALRPWPWILVALAALVLYPHGVRGTDGKVDAELNYIQAMIDHLPASLRGLMIAGFLSAYMSTMGTHLNLGASYLTNDIYRRFIRRDATERHYVWVSRAATLVVMVLAIVGAYGNDSVGGAYIYLYNLTAGVGLVMILRWYWWRVNAWSEIPRSSPRPSSRMR